jgi:hypothetical protein
MRCQSAAAGGSFEKKESTADGPKSASIEEEEDQKASGGFLSLVRGNNLTLNDYIQMMNTGMYNDLDETEDNDAEIEEYKHYNRGAI